MTLTLLTYIFIAIVVLLPVMLIDNIINSLSLTQNIYAVCFTYILPCIVDKKLFYIGVTDFVLVIIMLFWDPDYEGSIIASFIIFAWLLVLCMRCLAHFKLI